MTRCEKCAAVNLPHPTLERHYRWCPVWRDALLDRRAIYEAAPVVEGAA